MRLEISCQDRSGVTQDVLDILNEYNIDLRGIEIDAPGKIFLDVPNVAFTELQELMPKMRRVHDVQDVKTTAFMPNQRDQSQLTTLIESLPDPVFSIDIAGKVILYNDAVSGGLEMSHQQICALNIDDLIEGFNFHRWLNRKHKETQSHKIKFIQQEYIAEIVPVTIPDGEQAVFAGAMIILKSERRVEKSERSYQTDYGDSFLHFDVNSTAMKRTIKEAKRMALLDANMLITGHTGSGKERLAKACHDSSRRDKGEFVTLNCSSLPDDVAETELFGFAKGGFHQHASKVGLFEQATGGTLLLEDVSELSMQLQAKLLRVLEYGTYQQVGDSKLKYIDCRIICTSCKDMAECVQDGTFREDLLYRLSVLSIVVPSLRERKADIVSLANKLVSQHAKKLGRQVPSLSKPCIEYLESYPWPGNVRQLKNALYRAMALIDGNEITREAIQLPNCSASVTYIDENFNGTLEQEVKRFEKDMLKRLYPSYPSTRQLARKLGLSHTAIANKLREYGISKHSVKV